MDSKNLDNDTKTIDSMSSKEQPLEERINDPEALANLSAEQIAELADEYVHKKPNTYQEAYRNQQVLEDLTNAYLLKTGKDWY